MTRFVILEHDHPQHHWDFLVEAGTFLRTWQLREPPQPGRAVVAVPSFNHRLIYLDYEGPISGNRGTVQRWDAGTCTYDQNADALMFHFAGQRLHGRARLGPTERGEWVFLLLDEPRELTAAQIETDPPLTY